MAVRLRERAQAQVVALPLLVEKPPGPTGQARELLLPVRRQPSGGSVEPLPVGPLAQRPSWSSRCDALQFGEPTFPGRVLPRGPRPARYHGKECLLAWRHRAVAVSLTLQFAPLTQRCSSECVLTVEARSSVLDGLTKQSQVAHPGLVVGRPHPSRNKAEKLRPGRSQSTATLLRSLVMSPLTQGLSPFYMLAAGTGMSLTGDVVQQRREHLQPPLIVAVRRNEQRRRDGRLHRCSADRLADPNSYALAHASAYRPSSEQRSGVSTATRAPALTSIKWPSPDSVVLLDAPPCRPQEGRCLACPVRSVVQKSRGRW